MWTEDAGKLFFRTDRPINPNKIQGILEVDCISSNCLNEAAAIKFVAVSSMARLSALTLIPKKAHTESKIPRTQQQFLFLADLKWTNKIELSQPRRKIASRSDH